MTPGQTPPSPLPWRVERTQPWEVLDANGETVYLTLTTERIAMIVEAVNTHAELQAEVARLKDQLTDVCNRNIRLLGRAESAEAQLTEAQETVRTLSHQLERRASGQDYLTSALAKERDDLQVQLTEAIALIRDGLGSVDSTESERSALYDRAQAVLTAFYAQAKP